MNERARAIPPRSSASICIAQSVAPGRMPSGASHTTRIPKGGAGCMFGSAGEGRAGARPASPPLDRHTLANIASRSATSGPRRCTDTSCSGRPPSSRSGRRESIGTWARSSQYEFTKGEPSRNASRPSINTSLACMKCGKRLSPRTSIRFGATPRVSKNLRSGRAVLRIHVALSRMRISGPSSFARPMSFSAISSSREESPSDDVPEYAAQSASNASCAMCTDRRAR